MGAQIKPIEVKKIEEITYPPISEDERLTTKLLKLIRPTDIIDYLIADTKQEIKFLTDGIKSEKYFMEYEGEKEDQKYNIYMNKIKAEHSKILEQLKAISKTQKKIQKICAKGDYA